MTDIENTPIGRGRRPERPRSFASQLWPRLARGVATAAVTCLPVGVLAVLVRSQWGPLLAVDRDAIAAGTDITRDHPEFREGLILWQEIFQPWHVYLAAASVVVWVWYRGLRGRAIWGLVTMLVGWNLGLDVKLLVQRARPLVENPVSTAPGFSFPSGHAFNATMATTTCLVLVWTLLHSRLARIAALTGFVAIVGLTALNRVYLGVHYPSDVVAGVLLAVGLVGASWAGFMYRRRHTGRPDTFGPPAEST